MSTISYIFCQLSTFAQIYLEKYKHVLYNFTMNKSKISSEEIIENTIKYVAAYGLENVTAKKIAETMNISEGSIFNRFATKTKLLTECLYYIDRKIDTAIGDSKISILDLNGSVKKLWYKYFSFLVEHKDYAKFYRQFRQSSYYTPEVIKGQDESFSLFVKIIRKNLNLVGFNTDLLWVYVIETTLNFAVRIADGDIPKTRKNVERIYNLMARGFMGNFKL